MSASAAARPPSANSWPLALIDYAHIVVVPIVLGRGERLWDGLEGLEERFQIEAVTSPSGVTHVTLSLAVTAGSMAGQEAGRRPKPFSTS